MISNTILKEVSNLEKQKEFSLEEHFFGSVTVGERGQVVIPAEARKKLGITSGEKLVVMRHPFGDGIVLLKIDSMREFLSSFLEGLSVASAEGTGAKPGEH